MSLRVSDISILEIHNYLAQLFWSGLVRGPMRIVPIVTIGAFKSSGGTLDHRIFS